MIEVTAETITEDRKRRGLSRNKYGALVGLSSTQIHNLEHGRQIRPEERQKFEALFTGQPAPPPDESPPVADAPAPEPPPPVSPSGAEGESPVPVVLLTDEDEEEDDDMIADVGPPPQSVAESRSMPTRYEFKLPGYHVSNSELTCFKRCRRKWGLAYYRELRLKTPAIVGVRGLGTKLHIALSAYYSPRRDDPMEVLEGAFMEDRARLDATNDVDTIAALDKDLELARAMLEGYFEWLRETGADEGLEVIGDEMVVEVPFMENPPVVLVGKLDVRLRRVIDGARLFMDHKSVGSLTDPLKTLHLDEQMLHYHLLEFLEFLAAGATQEAADQERAHGGLYNMMRRVKRTAAAKPPFYDRFEVRHNVHELRSYYTRVVGEVQEILRLRQQLDSGADFNAVAYPTPKRDCSWDCDFLPVCPMFDDGSAVEEMLAEFYERHDPHDHYYPYGEREDTMEVMQ